MYFGWPRHTITSNYNISGNDCAIQELNFGCVAINVGHVSVELYISPEPDSFLDQYSPVVRSVNDAAINVSAYCCQKLDGGLD